MLPSYYFLQNLDTHSTDVTTTLRKCIRWAPIRGDTFLDRQLNFSSILVWDILTSESMRGLHFAVPTSHRFRLQRYGRSRFVMRTWSLGVWYNLTELLVCLLRRGINMPDSDCVILLLSAPERLHLENELFLPWILHSIRDWRILGFGSIIAPWFNLTVCFLRISHCHCLHTFRLKAAGVLLSEERHKWLQ